MGQGWLTPPGRLSPIIVPRPESDTTTRALFSIESPNEVGVALVVRAAAHSPRGAKTPKAECGGWWELIFKDLTFGPQSRPKKGVTSSLEFSSSIQLKTPSDAATEAISRADFDRKRSASAAVSQSAATMTAGEVNHTRKASNDNVRTSGTATRPKSPSSSQWASKIGHRPWPSMSQVESEAELADRSVPRNSMSAPNSRRASASSHRRGPSVGQVEAEAHKPTLKGVGKSDCEVKIVNIMDCETSVPIASLSEKNQSKESGVNDCKS